MICLFLLIETYTTTCVICEFDFLYITIYCPTPHVNVFDILFHVTN